MPLRARAEGGQMGLTASDIKAVRPVFREKEHTYWYQNRRLAGFSEIMKAQGLSDFSGVPVKNLEYARAIGEAAHLAIQFDCQGRLNEATVTDDYRPYLTAFRDFRQAVGFEPILIEEPVANLQYGYATKIDLLGTRRGHRNKPTLFELKTCDPKDNHAIQMESQALCFKQRVGKYRVYLMDSGKWKPLAEDKRKSAYWRALWLSAVTIFHHNNRKQEDLWRP